MEVTWTRPRVRWLAAPPRKTVRVAVVGLGAGPGQQRVYFVDLPEIYFPGVVDIGNNTKITLPMEALVGDAVAYARRYTPAVAADMVNAAWPQVLKLGQRDLPGFLEAEVMPIVRVEEQKILKGVYLAAAVIVFGVAGALWYFLRRK